MSGDLPLMKTREAAAYLGVSESTLEKLRLNGGGPRFLRIAGRSVRYRQADLGAWAEARACQSTSEYEARP